LHSVSQAVEQVVVAIAVQVAEHLSTNWTLQLIEPALHEAEQLVS